MINYIVGKIIYVGKKTITLENNYMGFVLNVGNSKNFEVGKIKKLFVYSNISLNNNTKLNIDLYGFETAEEKEFFYSLIKLSGIGPKNAISIMANSTQLLKQLVASKDIEGLTCLGISVKNAKLMCDELVLEVKAENNNNLQIIKALQSLGYSKEDIDYAINGANIEYKEDISEAVTMAIRAISSRGERC